MLTKENLWQRIKEHEGEIFHTTGRYLPFTYKVLYDCIIVNDKMSLKIYRQTLEELYKLKPKKHYEIKETLFTKSYIISILNDPRITF